MDPSGPERVPLNAHKSPYTCNSASNPPRAPIAEYEPNPGRDEENVSADANEKKKNSSKIGGLSPRAFWLLIVLNALIVIRASVGGAIGGTRGSNRSSPASTITACSGT
jgi:hypothetical protein